MKIIETERLILRNWKEEDKEPYFRINQDPKVIQCLPGAMSMEQVEEFIRTMNLQQDKCGYSLWAVEIKDTGEFAGFIGLNYIQWEARFTPAVEVGWRLGSEFWGKGYATEGAIAALNYGFNKCNLTEIVAITVPANSRSLRVMEKIGMKRDINGDFTHPRLSKDHPLSNHVLYRIIVSDNLIK